eukprot:11179815-Lingulodinium_polyedra.AAC.1
MQLWAMSSMRLDLSRPMPDSISQGLRAFLHVCVAAWMHGAQGSAYDETMQATTYQFDKGSNT